jgi:hypothetical protein
MCFPSSFLHFRTCGARRDKARAPALPTASLIESDEQV